VQAHCLTTFLRRSIDEDLLVANEIQGGRKHVSGGSQDRNDDVGDKHEDPNGYLAMPTIF
jgi:hypothetical protein